MHEVRRRQLFHVDRVVDEHGCIPVNEGLEDSIIVWKETHIGINQLVCFCRIGDSIRAQVIVNCFNSLADRRSLKVILFDISKARCLIDWLLIFSTDSLVTEMALSELILECFDNCLGILR